MNTRERVLLTTQELLAEGGIAAVSFDAIARRLGLTKQAVLYWFPSRQELLAEMFVGWLGAEADVAIQALQDSEAPVAAFVRAVAGFHLTSLDRFRMMYLVPQTLRGGSSDLPEREVMDRVHATTGRLYGALAERLSGDPVAARQQAVAIHSSVLGLVLLHGLAEATGDALKHSAGDLVEAMVARLNGMAG